MENVKTLLLKPVALVLTHFAKGHRIVMFHGTEDSHAVTFDGAIVRVDVRKDLEDIHTHLKVRVRGVVPGRYLPGHGISFKSIPYSDIAWNPNYKQFEVRPWLR